MLFQRRSRPVIGLDITTSSIKLIELSRSGDGYRVESYAAEPSPPNAINEKAIVDAQAVGEAVRRAVKRAGARSTCTSIARMRSMAGAAPAPCVPVHCAMPAWM